MMFLKFFQSLTERSTLRCTFISNSYWLRIGPMKIQINSLDPFHLTVKELLYNHECDEIKKPLAPKLRTHQAKKPNRLKRREWSDVRVMKKYVISITIYDFKLSRIVL